MIREITRYYYNWYNLYQENPGNSVRWTWCCGFTCVRRPWSWWDSYQRVDGVFLSSSSDVSDWNRWKTLLDLLRTRSNFRTRKSSYPNAMLRGCTHTWELKKIFTYDQFYSWQKSKMRKIASCIQFTPISDLGDQGLTLDWSKDFVNLSSFFEALNATSVA